MYFCGGGQRGRETDGVRVFCTGICYIHEDGDEAAILMDIEGGKGAPVGGYFKMALLGGTAAPADEDQPRSSTHP